MLVVAVLLCLGIMNIVVRASWTEMDDGVLWRVAGSEVVASEVATDSPAARAGVQAGDTLLRLDGIVVESPVAVVNALHGASRGTVLTYSVLRTQGGPQLLDITVDQIPAGARGLYYALAVVGIFSLLVGAAVRLRRPDHQATLHFFWLCIAFFGMLAFSFSGRLDVADWIFYWGDISARLLLPPLFVHFALVFPERSNSWVRSDNGRRMLPLIYMPAALLGGAEVAVVLRSGSQGPVLSGIASLIERGELAYLAISLVAGLGIMIRALRRGCSVTARRQLRWIVWGTALGAVPFVFGYVLPYTLGYTPSSLFESTAVLLGLVPLAFASAIIRYRLMDVEVIIKRALVSAAALAAIAAIYAVLLGLAGRFFLHGQESNSVIALLATIVVVLLSSPVTNAIQNALDRVYYRDRYDYRRALVGFARDLNSDLDLPRLSERLVRRVTETLVVDRMALLLPPTTAGHDDQFVTIAHHGFGATAPSLRSDSDVARRLTAGHTLTLDDPLAQHRLE
ncbi:MAG: histidine kinase N-terminal 7TM domain-containing protein, partial [Vicinamibacterales bacterium]